MMYRESTPLAVSPTEAPMEAQGPGRGVRRARRQARRGTFKSRIAQIRCQNFGKGPKCRKN
tara:strand:+ start:1224 stop:1406 length:183 start_codon:yes stop_codon:yes gene_type:complete